MEPEYLKMEPDSDSDNFNKKSPFQTFCSGSIRNRGVCEDFFGLTWIFTGRVLYDSLRKAVVCLDISNSYGRSLLLGFYSAEIREFCNLIHSSLSVW